jgi:hypothetical protein
VSYFLPTAPHAKRERERANKQTDTTEAGFASGKHAKKKECQVGYPSCWPAVAIFSASFSSKNQKEKITSSSLLPVYPLF